MRILRHLLAISGAGALLLALTSAAAAKYTRSSSAVCQPDNNHADWDFTTQGKLRNTAAVSRHVACDVPGETGLDGVYTVDVGFGSGSQNSNCQLRAYDLSGNTTLMSDSQTWLGGFGELHLGITGFSATYKVVQLRCEIVPGGSIVSIGSNVH